MARRPAGAPGSPLERAQSLGGRRALAGQHGMLAAAAWALWVHRRSAPPAPCLPQYDAKLCEFMDTYDRAFLVHADNVGSKQFMDIRAVRGS